MREETLIEITTETATYLQHPASHQSTTHISSDTVQELDAVVLESGIHRYEEVTLDDLAAMQQYRELVAQCRREQVPIFLVDLPYRGAAVGAYTAAAVAFGVPSVLGVFGAVHGHPALGLLAVPALSLWWGGDTSGTGSIGQYAQVSTAYTSFGYRSAVAAEKMDTVIAPSLGNDPAVFVEYGAAHRDIGAYLRHPRLRDAVLALHDQLPAHSVDTTYRDTVCAFRFDDGDYVKDIREGRF